MSNGAILFLEFVSDYNLHHSISIFQYHISQEEKRLEEDDVFIIRTFQHKVATALFYYIKDNI